MKKDNFDEELRNALQEYVQNSNYEITEKVKFSGEVEMTPEEKINELSGFEKAFFKKMFAGKFAKNLYKIFTYKV